MYTAPVATDLVECVFVLRACIENRIAPIATSHSVPTAVRTKKVILKIRSWFPETEMEPWTLATPASELANEGIKTGGVEAYSE